jgi:hypothetical protein
MTPRQENNPKQADEGAWKLDRHIPIAVIFTMLAQGAMIVWWGAGIDNRLSQETERNDRQDTQIEAARARDAAQEVVAATATADLRAVRDSLGEVKQTLAEQNTLLREILTNGKAKP